MKINKLLLLILIMSSFVYCKTYDNNSQDNNDLIGEWNWISTDGGMAFHIHDTPESTGKTITLKLTADYKYSYTENGIVKSEGTYTISLKNSIYDHSEKRFINFSNDKGMLIEFVSQENLKLVDNMHDGIGSTYEKIK